LLPLRLSTSWLDKPEEARLHALEAAGSLRKLVTQADAAPIAELFESAFTGHGADRIHAACTREYSGTLLGAIARLFRSCGAVTNTAIKAADHLSIAPSIIDSASTWRAGYERIALPFFEAFWDRELARNGFRFRTPGDLRKEFVRAKSLPQPARLKRMLSLVADGLDLEVPPTSRQWLET
jgi:hypothetical protein